MDNAAANTQISPGGSNLNGTRSRFATRAQLSPSKRSHTAKSIAVCDNVSTVQLVVFCCAVFAAYNWGLLEGRSTLVQLDDRIAYNGNGNDAVDRRVFHRDMTHSESADATGVSHEDSSDAMQLTRADAPCDCNHGTCFFGKCFCSPGWTGEHCESGRDSTCKNDQDLRCLYSEMGGVLRTPPALWKQASKAELAGWIRLRKTWNDRSEEHENSFDGYKTLLQRQKLGDVMEIGCGPFTQSNWIMDVTKINATSITLVDPNVLNYATKVENCAYKGGQLRGLPTRLFASGGEAARFEQNYDTIVMINVIEHCYDAYKIFANLHGSLRPGGILVLHDRWYDTVLENGDFFDKAKHDSIGREKHPIRPKRVFFEHFIRQFDVLYRTDTTPLMSKRGDTGTYVILQKPLGGVKQTQLPRARRATPLRPQHSHDMAQVRPASNPFAVTTDKFTLVVVMYYPERFKILKQNLYPLQYAPDLERIVIIWNNLQVQPFSVVDLGITAVPTAVVQASINTIMNRFNASLIGLTTDCVMFLDDDMEITTSDMQLTFTAWNMFPERIVGGFKRSHREKLQTSGTQPWQYIFNPRGDEPYSIVLPGAGTCVHRHYLYLYGTAKYKPVRDMVMDVRDCDDIFLNMIASKESRKAPMYVKTSVRSSEDTNSTSVGLFANGGGKRRQVRGDCINFFEQTYGPDHLLYQRLDMHATNCDNNPYHC
eukprot:m.152354 g.152354  ORF g.152354 m.152354 type:complete len:710 (+) comp17891_c0_seq2:509-2638(+)